jgi:hypothetical protein
MKQICISTICVLAIIAVGAVAFSVHYANQTTSLRSQWQTESKANKEKLAEYADIVESNQQVVARLEKGVSTLDGVLTDFKGQLAAANDKIQANTLAEQNRQEEQRKNEEHKKNLASVPEPVLVGKTFVFSKVVGIHNEILATNAAFAYVAGRRLIFRLGDQTPMAVDVDNIHPLILEYLGIDADAAKLNQQRLDAAYGADRRAGAALTSQYERDQQAKKEREAALAIEQEKADAAQQQAWAAQQQAQADRQKADALMFNATKPSQPVNVIQQSQQIQQSPGWHLQNGLWYWY